VGSGFVMGSSVSLWRGMWGRILLGWSGWSCGPRPGRRSRIVCRKQPGEGKLINGLLIAVMVLCALGVLAAGFVGMVALFGVAVGLYERLMKEDG